MNMQYMHALVYIIYTYNTNLNLIDANQKHWN